MAKARNVLDRNIAAVNGRDLDAYLANQAPDVEFVLPGGITLHGREQVGQYTRAMWTAFPDGVLEFGDQVLTDDAAATEVTFRGTHTGPLLSASGELPPTGRKVVLRSVSMLHINNGQVVSEHVYLDQLELLRQLGVATDASK